MFQIKILRFSFLKKQLKWVNYNEMILNQIIDYSLSNPEPISSGEYTHIYKITLLAKLRKRKF